MTPIEAASHDLAQAQSTLADATAKAVGTADTLNVLTGRLAAKQQDLSAIQARRLNGDEGDSDAPMAQLITLDIAGIEPLVASASAAHQSAVLAQQEAQQQVQHAGTALERAQAAAGATALEERLRELETLLMTGIGQLYHLKKVATNSLHVHGTTLFNVSPRLQRFIQTGVLPG